MDIPDMFTITIECFGKEIDFSVPASFTVEEMKPYICKGLMIKLGRFFSEDQIVLYAGNRRLLENVPAKILGLFDGTFIKAVTDM